MAQATPPRQSVTRFLPILEGIAQDEAAIRLAVLRRNCREQGATHVGWEQERDLATDLDPEMMKALLACRPSLQPVSDLVNPDPKGRVSRFTLVTVEDLKWETLNRVRVYSIYRADGQGYSFRSYVATRGTTSKTGASNWSLEREIIACGSWSKFAVLRNGRPITIEFSER
jgi:hypothetical protein